jgi:hypothetical protein
MAKTKAPFDQESFFFVPLEEGHVWHPDSRKYNNGIEITPCAVS